RAADDAVRADRRARLRGGAVVLADVDAVGVARLHEVGAVVEDEQRAVRVGGGAERLRRLDQLLVGERLVAQLDQVGAAPLLGVGLRALDGFPGFCAELGVELHLNGTLVVARDRDEAEELEQLLEYRRKLGLAVERLRPSQARRAEPALAPTVRLALDVPGD